MWAGNVDCVTYFSWRAVQSKANNLKLSFSKRWKFINNFFFLVKDDKLLKRRERFLKISLLQFLMSRCFVRRFRRSKTKKKVNSGICVASSFNLRILCVNNLRILDFLLLSVQLDDR